MTETAPGLEHSLCVNKENVVGKKKKDSLLKVGERDLLTLHTGYTRLVDTCLMFSVNLRLDFLQSANSPHPLQRLHTSSS